MCRAPGFTPSIGGVFVAHRCSFLYFVCLCPVLCVLRVESVSKLFILDCLFGFLYRLFIYLPYISTMLLFVYLDSDFVLYYNIVQTFDIDINNEI
jgi:hypothetical protein